jgi:hypothetical protein
MIRPRRFKSDRDIAIGDEKAGRSGTEDFRRIRIVDKVQNLVLGHDEVPA